MNVFHSSGRGGIGFVFRKNKVIYIDMPAELRHQSIQLIDVQVGEFSELRFGDRFEGGFDNVKDELSDCSFEIRHHFCQESIGR